MNRFFACRLEHARGTEWFEHLNWLFRLEIISIVDSGK